MEHEISLISFTSTSQMHIGRKHSTVGGLVVRDCKIDLDKPDPGKRGDAPTKGDVLIWINISFEY